MDAVKRINWGLKSLYVGDLGLDLDRGVFHGVIDNLPSDKYHGLKKYYSSSDLKYINQNSLHHFKHREKLEPSADMILGSVVHCLLLTPDSFNEEFYVCDRVDKRTKEGKERAKYFELEAGSRVLVNEGLFTEATGMVASIQKNKYAMDLLEGISREVAFFWKCPFTGLNYRSKVDACSSDYLVEVKTSRSANPSAFERHSFNMDYDLSAYHYSEGMRFAFGDMPKKVYFVVCENKFPWVSQVYECTDEFLSSGHTKWLDVSGRLELAQATDKWISYGEGVLPLSVPKWAVPKAEMVTGSDEDTEVFGGDGKDANLF